MTSAPVRDPLADHLITPENAAFLFIDYQPAQLAAVRSMDHALLVKNAVSTVRTIKTFEVPVVHSTVGRHLAWRWHTAMRPRSGGRPSSSPAAPLSAASCSAPGRWVSRARPPRQMTGYQPH
jgi:nicotinamidase-related amidase